MDQTPGDGGRTFSPGQVASKLGLGRAIEAAWSAVDTALGHAAAAGDLADLALVALDEGEVAAGHQLGHGPAADMGRCRADRVVHDRIAAFVVRLDGFEVVRDALAGQGAHVDEEGAVKLTEIDGLLAVRGHDGGSAPEVRIVLVIQSLYVDNEDRGNVHGQRNVGHKVRHDKVDHVVHQGVRLDHLLHDRGHRV